MQYKRRINAAKGFTLVELLVVIALISAVAAIAVPRMMSLAVKAKEEAARADMRVIRDAFLDEEGGYLRDMGSIAGFSASTLRIANLLIATNVYGVVKRGNRYYEERVDDIGNFSTSIKGVAPPQEWIEWNEEAHRGWRGPYVKKTIGAFPAAQARRFADDATFRERGFYPDAGGHGLGIANDLASGRDDCSVYGFPGEGALMDPWGNPYILQVPPPEAFLAGSTNIVAEERFKYARIVSAGGDGRLDTPCFEEYGWNERTRRLVRQAGLIDGDDVSRRGDDLVLFLNRNDIDEGERNDY